MNSAHIRTIAPVLLITFIGCSGSTAPDASADRQLPPSDGATSGTGCAGHTYLFCEDFETASPGSLPTGWSIDNGWSPGDPSVTADEHHGGTHALSSAVAAVGQNRAKKMFGNLLGASAGQHWGRVFYKVQSPAFMPSSGVVHNTIVGLFAGGNELRVVDTVENTQGAHQFLLNTPDDQCCIGSNYDYHSYDGAWHCAEWHVDQSTQSYHFYFDGAEVTDIAFPHDANESRRPIGTFDGITVGWREYQNANPPYHAWIDDVAIDSTRIGCN